MKTIDELINKTVRFLWLIVGYFGLIEIVNAAKVSPNDNGFIGAVILLLLGGLNVFNAYSLFRKKRWAFRSTTLVAISNILFFSLFFFWTMVIFNIYIGYTALRFRDLIGAHKTDSLIHKKWFFRR